MVYLITEDTYAKEVLGAGIPVLLDVFTPHCNPCKSLLPTIVKLAEEYAGRVKIVKLDAFKEGDLAMSLRVSKVPTLIVFKGGKEVERKSGFLYEPQLRKWLEEITG